MQGKRGITQFNLLYIVAFSLNTMKCLVQISAISYYFSENRMPPLIVDNTLAYYITYMFLEFVPIVLCLISMKVSQDDKGDSTSERSNRSSIEAEMVDRDF